MPVIPTRDLGAVGIIKDNSPTVIPPNAFSDGINVRFTERKVSRAPVFRTYFDALSGTVPVWCHSLFNTGGYDSIVYATDVGRLFLVANAILTDVTEPGHVANADPRAYTGCVLSSCLYANRPDGVPRVLTPGSPNFVNLPAWNGTWRAVSLRSYKSFLIALNVTKGVTQYPNLVKWSDVASNNAAPTTWDELDTTHLAGENPLSQARTPIVDGGPLGDNFIIYTHDEVWKMNEVGGQFIFDFQRLPFDNAGLINQNCWIEIDGKHYAWSDSDIYVHDGAGKQSIMEQRNRETFFREINQVALCSPSSWPTTGTTQRSCSAVYLGPLPWRLRTPLGIATMRRSTTTVTTHGPLETYPMPASRLRQTPTRSTPTRTSHPH
jgi:hypothetical protein